MAIFGLRHFVEGHYCGHLGDLFLCFLAEMPGRKGSGAAKAKASKKAAKPSPAVLAKQEAEARRDTTQALRENPAFKGFGSQQLHGIEVNEKSLYLTIYEDKLKKIRTPATAPKFGAPYYRSLAAAFRGVSVVRAGVFFRCSGIGGAARHCCCSN